MVKRRRVLGGGIVFSPRAHTGIWPKESGVKEIAGAVAQFKSFSGDEKAKVSVGMIERK